MSHSSSHDATSQPLVAGVIQLMQAIGVPDEEVAQALLSGALALIKAGHRPQVWSRYLNEMAALVAAPAVEGN